MSSLDWAFVAGGIAVVGYIFSLEWRLKNVQRKLTLSQQATSDLETEKRIRDLPDDQLDAELNKRLGG